MSVKGVNFHQFTSYSYYIGLKTASWVKPEQILTYFKGKKDEFGYHSYGEFFKGDEGDQNVLGELILEEEE